MGPKLISTNSAARQWVRYRIRIRSSGASYEGWSFRAAQMNYGTKIWSARVRFSKQAQSACGNLRNFLLSVTETMSQPAMSKKQTVAPEIGRPHASGRPEVCPHPAEYCYKLDNNMLHQANFPFDRHLYGRNHPSFYCKIGLFFP